MIKKISLGIFAILFIAFISYFFIYPADFKANFKAKTLPGTINQTIKAWNIEVEGDIISQEGFESITQRLKFGDSTQIYTWQFKTLDDSTTAVTVSIKDEKHSFMNRLKKPFSDIPLKTQSSKTVKEFYSYLNDHIEEFRVTYDGESELKSTYCAYVPLKGKQSDKAKGMMQNYTMLASVMANHNVELNGPPFVEVTDWNIEKDSISYNFCFPIKRSDKLPDHHLIKYKRIFAKKSLKATYNGNYITSDRAWYLLMKKSKDENKPVDLTPIEYFYNNPNFGGDALRWKAEIYLPLKTQTIEKSE